ncbi:PH and SEC7 domain-containing protein 1-like [Neopelma chrysocephalum]|uniref:PH and SEC7 domain-containing protein 1-like n=1 Tax=Neopelma chrysocephalum TaxID=114329 RepID=UPI000FCD3EAB|nr:PH and SEC7 domain-containing protein 1-like [Neopelma chrysocephalum]
MTSSEFVSNLSGMNDGQDFPREQLKALYGSIRSRKLEWATEEEEEEEAGGGKKILPQIPELPGGAVTFRRGWLARKVLAEADGKKSESGGIWGAWGTGGRIGVG